MAGLSAFWQVDRTGYWLRCMPIVVLAFERVSGHRFAGYVCIECGFDALVLLLC